MRIVVVHLSDIHIRDAGNPILARADQLSAAVNSADASAGLILFVISGDIAFSGGAKEYSLALKFFMTLKEKLHTLRPEVRVEFVCIPGNHDCVLPETDERLRSTLIQGAMASFQDLKPDQSLLSQVLRVQRPYKNFHKKLTGQVGAWDGVCEMVFVEHEDRRIQLNLYNTAILSRRHEEQGQLHVPVEVLRQRVALGKNSALSISVFHHSYLWIESNVATAFRNQIERTSDVALSGHQHYSHDFYKQNSTGERVLYLEADALQDEKYPQKSAFQILVFDLDAHEERSIKFRWASGDQMYRMVEEGTWRAITVNRAIRAEFRTSRRFEEFLQEVGSPLWHRRKGALRLRDVFVYPDVVVRSPAPKTMVREISGDDLLKYVVGADRIIFQASGLGGKTSLAKVLYSEILSAGDMVPLLIRAEEIASPVSERSANLFWRAFSDQYDSAMTEAFQQLPKAKRGLLIDNWDKANLSGEGRKAFLEICNQHFSKVLLFADDLFQIQELVDQSAATMFEFDHATIQQLRHGQRGLIIDRWVTLNQEHTGDKLKLGREIEEKETLIRGLIGKNTLPSLPFVVLCILEADQEGKAETAEAGSFGYLYEVLVTTSLNATTGSKPQLEKKYIFLAKLAYRMFQLDVRALSLSYVEEVADKYRKSHLVKLDLETMLEDLEASRVLLNDDGNYSFTYQHFFHYFVARYYKDNLDRENGSSLRAEIDAMVDRLSSNRYSTVLMFIMYFARDTGGIIDKLVHNANQVYASTTPSDLQSDVVFLNQLCDQPEVNIPQKVDLEANRKARRESLDRVARSGAQLLSTQSREFMYSDDLSDKDKFELAFRHIELMGQVIRNFPASLPGTQKLAILKSSYFLGLRLMRETLRLLEFSTGFYRDALTAARKERNDVDMDKVAKLVEKMITVLSRLCIMIMLKKVSGNVGIADLEEAYRLTLDEVGRTNATRLIDLSIKLDHFKGFPDTEVRTLHKDFTHNAFADWVLSDLVMSHIAVFGIADRTRQSMASLFKVKANTPRLMDPSTKR